MGVTMGFSEDQEPRTASDADLDRIGEAAQDRFARRKRLHSFSQCLDHFRADPALFLRNSARYLLDTMEYFGSSEVDRIGMTDRRWNLFDLEFDRPFEGLVGQERVQNALYRQISQFAQRGRCDKLILLHGPNGSSKSTTVEALMRGLEYYSSLPEGALYRFNWVFPERQMEPGTIGFEVTEDDLPDTYAFLKPDEIAACLRCEMKDSPLFLIPKDDRGPFIDRILAEHEGSEALQDIDREWVVQGQLSPKNKAIYEALLTAYQGDWREVVRHIQVERYFISKRYRSGAVSIEPQGNIDAGSRPLQLEHSGQLPSVLQNVQIIETVGDLVDANKGIVEYSDFLKRPLEANKYLLTTSEKGTIALPGTIAFLDVVMMATANEKQLALFKRNPDFSSFKGRLALIGVPYLLRYSKEADLYDRHIENFARDRHVTPHTATVAALWAVLTRLRRPSPKNHGPDLAPIVARLTPLQKVMLYDHGEVPLELRDEERKMLKNAIRDLREEHNEAEGEFEGIYGAEYEGRRGASPREMMSLLAHAAENEDFDCLTPLAVFEELDKLVKDVSVFEFLRLPIDNGYHDCPRFIEDIKEHYRAMVEQEVFDSIGLVEEHEYERVFEEYFHHVKAFDLGEKLFVPSRNEYVEPSEDLMQRIEDLLEPREEIAKFRSGLMTKIAAYALDHPDEPINYRVLFPEIYNLLKQSFYRERDRALMIIEQNILKYFTEEREYLDAKERGEVERALGTMSEKYGYCHNCARDVIAFVLRTR